MRVQESQFKGRYNRQIFKTLSLAYSPYRFWIYIFLLMGLVGRALLLANANIIGIWVDSLCAGENCHQVNSLFLNFNSQDFVALLAGLSIVGFLLTWTFRIGFSDLSALAISTFYDETTTRTSRFPMQFFDQNPVGRIVTRFSSDYGNVFRLFGGPLAEFLSIVFDLFWMIILTSMAGIQFLPLILAMGFIQYLVYKKNRDLLRQRRRDLSSSRSPSIAHFSETVQGSASIRLFGRNEHFSERFEKLDKYFLDHKLKMTKAIVSFGLQMNFMTASLLLFACLIAYWGINSGFLTIGSAGVAFGFITLSGNTVQMFFEWLAQFEEAMVGVERMNQYLQSPIESGSALPSETKFSTTHRIAQYHSINKKNPLLELKSASVEFKDVHLKYNENLPWILKGLSFKIQAGEKVGIIGKTGAGKSSIIQSLFHLYPIQKGEILIESFSADLETETTEHTNQKDSRLLLNEFRQAMAYISQDSVLFRGSLRENLSLCNLNLMSEDQKKNLDNKMSAAMNKVGLGHWLQDPRLGLDRHIEEKGKNLSVGEKQLICMARCLLQETPIVILDEATSSVDPKSEEILMQATREFFKDKTQIIIAHRLSTLLLCDRVLWLKNGQAYRLGPPEEVLREFKNQSEPLSLK